MKCRSGDFARAVEHARRQIEKYVQLIPEHPSYRGQLRSALIALEALQLVRQHGMEGVLLGRVSDERPCGGSGIQGPECARCRRRCLVVYG